MARQDIIPEPLPASASEAQVAAWVRRLVRFVGPGFHPDTLFDDYVKADGARSFTSAECRYLESELHRAWEILDGAGMDIYGIALPVQRKLLVSR